MLDLILLSLNSFPLAQVARAEIYFSEEGVAHLMFPTIPMSLKEITLTDAQADQIEKLADEPVRNKKIRVFTAKTGEKVFIDRVLGKHEDITYAVGLNADGSVKQIEIMEYKETYGGDVRKKEWRDQFVGKQKNSSLQLKTDIKNISGATLSSMHLTNGVRRVLQTEGVIHAQL
jgi:Na+-translocating ferredoxin:NAD+ oxidoreductase RnfG subunit